MVNQNGLDPPRQLRKMVNPNGLDPPDQLGPKEELDLLASEGATRMQNQEMASGGEQSIICTGSRSRSRSQERAKHPRDDRCRACGKYGRDREESPRERSRKGGYRRRHGQEGHPYDERSRAYGVKGSPVHGEPRRPRERSREGGNEAQWQHSRSPHERPRESGYGRQQHLGSPSERSRESGDREPSPDIEKSGVSQK
ncbi:hypothetical protein PoB_006836800 [Plakobranchus ocellatus]|uniref:Uncharacterized protein n=1 Tax=Plakobranchus ocellatus TaxID=259542 RepID=A0AAV4DC90_9GAST|nr:hypothetical protein PoB_006836800 [Plakobranchus ocellatus]